MEPDGQASRSKANPHQGTAGHREPARREPRRYESATPDSIRHVGAPRDRYECRFCGSIGPGDADWERWTIRYWMTRAGIGSGAGPTCVLWKRVAWYWPTGSGGSGRPGTRRQGRWRLCAAAALEVRGHHRDMLDRTTRWNNDSLGTGGPSDLWLVAGTSESDREQRAAAGQIQRVPGGVLDDDLGGHRRSGVHDARWEHHAQSDRSRSRRRGGGSVSGARGSRLESESSSSSRRLRRPR